MNQVVITFWTSLSKDELQKLFLQSNLPWQAMKDIRMYDNSNLAVWLPMQGIEQPEEKP